MPDGQSFKKPDLLLDYGQRKNKYIQTFVPLLQLLLVEMRRSLEFI